MKKQTFHPLRRATLSATALGALLLLLSLPPAFGQKVDQNAHPFLAGFFTDNMVLQRGQSDPVWGWTTPGAKVSVRASGRVVARMASAVAGTDGKWLARLPALPTGGPYTLTVTGPDQTVKTLGNVLVGDVWVCSGQSNMEFGLGNTINADQEIAAANYPNLRLMIAPHSIALSPQPTTTASWVVCTPETVRQGGWNGFSAVGYFFGRDLQQDIHVPIGLIETSWGGTPAEAWVSEASLAQKLPAFRAQLAQLKAERPMSPDARASWSIQQVAGWYRQNDPGSKSYPGWAAADLDDSSWQPIHVPGAWEGSGIPQLANYDGTLWYRRNFDLPASAAGKDLTLHFVADDDDTTWVNGVLVGATNGWATPRSYTIPSKILHAGSNVIAVRVLDTGGAGGIYGQPESVNIEVTGGDPIALAGTWRYRIGIPLNQATPVPSISGIDQNFPTTLYNGMVYPLEPYSIKGALWYQGETNVGRGYQYRTLLPTLIGDWRQHFGEGSFPFLIVQLAGWQHPPAQPGDDANAEVREAQWLTALGTPNAGMATALDIGDPDDIHPKNKQEVGRRLALVARRLVYHENVEDSGPVYKSMQVQGNTARITFSHAEGGLVERGSGPVVGFQIAGSDQKWAWADAKIDGSSVIVSSPQVPHPVAVRYAWASWLPLNLYNKDRLPVYQFRTDNWKLLSQ